MLRFKRRGYVIGRRKVNLREGYLGLSTICNMSATVFTRILVVKNVEILSSVFDRC